MTLNRLIKTASQGYPDGLVEKIHKKSVLLSGKAINADDGSSPRDGLASFIASEIKETFDADASNKEQLDTAIGVVDRAIEELTGVLNSLLKERFH